MFALRRSGRLAKPYWGKGYAREAATAALDYAFTELQPDEVLSFTAVADRFRRR